MTHKNYSINKIVKETALFISMQLTHMKESVNAMIPTVFILLQGVELVKAY